MNFSSIAAFVNYTLGFAQACGSWVILFYTLPLKFREIDEPAIVGGRARLFAALAVGTPAARSCGGAAGSSTSPRWPYVPLRPVVWRCCGLVYFAFAAVNAPRPALCPCRTARLRLLRGVSDSGAASASPSACGVHGHPEDLIGP